MLTTAPSSKAEMLDNCHDVDTTREGGSPRAPFLEVFA